MNIIQSLERYKGVNMIIKLKDKLPQVSTEAWIAENAAVVGNVTIGPESSVWYSASLRGDDESIKIGENTSIQDNVVIHVSKGHATTIGDFSTIGHQAIVHGCSIGSNVVIGMGAIVLNGAEIGDNCIIGAGSLVTENKKIPPNTLAYGNPIKIIRKLSQEEIESNRENALDYVKKSKLYIKSAKIIK